MTDFANALYRLLTTAINHALNDQPAAARFERHALIDAIISRITKGGDGAELSRSIARAHNNARRFSDSELNAAIVAVENADSELAEAMEGTDGDERKANYYSLKDAQETVALAEARLGRIAYNGFTDTTDDEETTQETAQRAALDEAAAKERRSQRAELAAAIREAAQTAADLEDIGDNYFRRLAGDAMLENPIEEQRGFGDCTAPVGAYELAYTWAGWLAFDYLDGKGMNYGENATDAVYDILNDSQRVRNALGGEELERRGD